MFGIRKTETIIYNDMHCHILPGVDDGAKDLKQTGEMLAIAYDSGIRTIIATPHFHVKRGAATMEEMNAALTDTKEWIQQNHKDMEIYLGNEIYYGSQTAELLREKRVATMAGSRYVLLEFDPTDSFHRIRGAVQECQAEGYFPIIAHVERYERVRVKEERAEELYNMGAYLQINAGTVTGRTGSEDKKYVKKLMDYNLVHFVASDAHGTTGRTPDMTEAGKIIVKRYGQERLKKYVYEHPQQVIHDEII